jgi:hypothetical protein
MSILLVQLNLKPRCHNNKRIFDDVQNYKLHVACAAKDELTSFSKLSVPDLRVLVHPSQRPSLASVLCEPQQVSVLSFCFAFGSVCGSRPLCVCFI